MSGFIRGRRFRFYEGAHFVDEFGDVAELFVDAREADVSDLVDVTEALHDTFADGPGRNFALKLGFEGIDYVFDQHGDLLEIDGAFVAGGADGSDEFFAIEFFAATVALDDNHTVTDDGLSRGVAVAAFEALAAAANG